MCKIVIIEDDIDICNMIKKFLENNKYSVQYALNGIEGINLCKSFVPDLIILDIMLPGLNGDDVLQKLRKFTNAPVIVVSAKTMVQTKIELLKIGADDYMTKPFDLYELLARIEANLKRTVDNPYQNNNTLIYKNIKINNSLVYINGVLVPFTSTELSILELLLQYPQKIFSKQNLYESIWNEPYAYDDDTINTHISHIRIIENLITNAIRYSDNYIEVSINQEGVFMIKNSTQSLDEMDINLLFSKFYTVDKSRTKGGSGLGLYIVKELLKKIDGKIGNIEYNKPILSITLFFRLFK